jgi:1-deoxyxylulose-5-phosphate synthase
MLHRPFGATGLTVSELGYGCAGWWGRPMFPEREAHWLVHRALELGVTVFDTGSSYARGEAEARLGRALAARDTGGLLIATKAGTLFRDGRIRRDFSPDAIEASVHQSLRKLGLGSLPLLQLHGPIVEDLGEGLVERLEQLRARGDVRFLGVNSFDPAVIGHAIGMPVFDAVMIDYNLMRPERAPLVAAAAAAGKAVLAGMPLAMGYFRKRRLGGLGLRDLWYAARALARHREDFQRGRRFSFVEDEPGWTGAQVALAYVLADRNVASAVFGATRRQHLQDGLAASGRLLPAELAARIAAAQREPGAPEPS